jgi:hypothetical protein
MVESNNLLFFSFKFEKFSFWSLYKVNKSEVRRKYGANTAMVPFEQLIIWKKWRSREMGITSCELQRIIESGNYPLCIINRLVGALPQTPHTFLP